MLQGLRCLPFFTLPPNLADHLRIEGLTQILEVMQLMLWWKLRVLRVISAIRLLFHLSSIRRVTLQVPPPLDLWPVQKRHGEVLCGEELLLQFFRRLPTDFYLVPHNGLDLGLRMLSLHRQGPGCIAAVIILLCCDKIDTSRTWRVLCGFLL